MSVSDVANDEYAKTADQREDVAGKDKLRKKKWKCDALVWSRSFRALNSGWT
jgi:hypothetical protein